MPAAAPDDLTFRPVDRAEIAELLALYRAVRLAGEGLPLERAQALHAEIAASPERELRVAVDPAGTIVGSYLLAVVVKLGHLGTPFAVVDDVAVAPGRQGQGVGTALMHDAMTRARAHRCYKLTLSSNLARRRAHRFYEKLGFAQHGLSFAVAL
jgi:GNAT superfamily N-acetyltransferase